MLLVHHDASAEFHAFFEQHHAELSRLAAMLIGEPDAAADLAADALVAVWHRWDRVRGADHPLAYARGVVANMARARIRAAVRERRRVSLFWSNRPEVVEAADVASVLDVRSALARLPSCTRSCGPPHGPTYRTGSGCSRAWNGAWPTRRPPPPGARPSPGLASPSPLSPPARPWWSAPTPWRR
ncbi:sigma factor [Streptomyces sp. NPDC059999]|uniref:sigma factor n=1 Tax=Streptomyces sp. NPDC059999 TaxID=3347030 RepID=UPI00367FE2B1